MSRLFRHPYFVAPVVILFAACENRFDQGEAIHVFKRSAAGDITEKKTEKDVSQNLPSGRAVDGPKVKAITDSNPTPEASVSSSGDSKMVKSSTGPRLWHNPDNVAVVALGSNSSEQKQKRTPYSEQTTDSKLGYIYYKIWTPVGSQKPHYPGILDENWSQWSGSQGNNGDTDNSGLKLATTPLRVGTVKLINDEMLIKIQGKLAQEMTYPGGKTIAAGTPWIWTGTWHHDPPTNQKPVNPCKNLYGRGTLTWSDVPPQ
jgi:hypothetical protein